MGLDVPIPGTTLGPAYASDVSDALTVIDAHRHTGAPTDGLQIPSAGLLINGDLSYHSNSAQDLRCTAYTDQSAVLSGPGDVSCLYSKGGDLYWNNAAGTPVRVTAGTVVEATGVNTVYETIEVAGDITILPADTYVFLEVDTTAARSITLPAANSVAAGRFYKVRDATGTAYAHPITIHRAGSDQIDGATSYVIRTLFGAVEIKSNGDAGWLADSSGNYALGNLSVGPSAARSGVIGIPNNAAITARNAANTNDETLIKLDASDIVQVGSGDGLSLVGSDILVQASGTVAIEANGATVLTSDGMTVGVGDSAIPLVLTAYPSVTIGTGSVLVEIAPGSTVFQAGDGTLGFFGTAPVNQPTGVGANLANIYAALIALGLISD